MIIRSDPHMFIDRTDRIINRLIKYTINTGALTRYVMFSSALKLKPSELVMKL